MKKRNLTKHLSLVILCGCLYFFWYWLYPSHVCNQEYFSLFQATPSYFLSCASMPGGVAEWLGAFLSQFYRWLWLGAFLQTVAVGALFYLICYNKDLQVRTSGQSLWCLVPALLLFFLQTQYSFLMGNNIQVVLWFAFFCIYSRLTDGKKRFWFTVLMYFPAIVLFGAFPAVFWLITVLLYEISKSSGWIRLFILGGTGLICGVVWNTVFPVYAGDWVTFFPGVQEFLHPGVAWLLYLFLPVVFTGHILRKRVGFPTIKIPDRVSTVAAVVFILLMLNWGRNELYYPSVEHMLKLQRDFLLEDWDAILADNQDYEGSRTSAYVLTNMALMKKGELPERALDYPQIGIAGLVQASEGTYFSALCRAWLYDLLGVKNEALHWSVESSLAHGENPPPYLMKQIAVLLMDMGKETAASRFLKRLVAVPFYQDWAREHLKRTAKAEFFRKQRLSQPLREEVCAVSEQDTLDFFVGMATERFFDLFQLAAKQPHNTVVRDYLLTGLLLEKDVTTFYDWFCKYFPQGYPGKLPRLYSEALIIVGYTGLDKEVTGKYRIPKEKLLQFRTYMDACRTFGDNQEMAGASLKQQYGNTFWYRVHFK